MKYIFWFCWNFPLLRSLLLGLSEICAMQSCASITSPKGDIHKGYTHLGRGRGLAIMWTKVDRGGRGLAVSGFLFQCGLGKRKEDI